ncbi:NADH-quinone oxidoreductase subunit C [Paenibacillus alkalitolerans]|uniref:NADH-quinone oxidoreductase subunit C n=1 Tax=Paenibacillus alkalitolerans TaxID=2799335 RepID=UPI002D7E9496|nr:NADH-quinone oxidoreductase subunit C [Paenibacillus alkalitolerans]
MTDDNVKRDAKKPSVQNEPKADDNKAPETPVEKAADELAKESGGAGEPKKMPESYDVSVPVNEKDVAEFTPEPDKDGRVLENAPGDKVKLEDGKATPTEETVKLTIEKQQPGGDTAEALAAEQRRDAEAAAEGKKDGVEIGSANTNPKAPVSDEEREARLKRAAEARAARAAAKGEDAGEAAAAPRKAAGKAEAAEEAKPKEPSPNQPQLDRAAAIIREAVAADAVEESSINEKSNDMPTLTVRNEHWLKTAEVLKSHPELSMNYLRNLSGVDQESHLEVVYHFINMTNKHELCVKVKTDRDNASVPSVTPLFATANWNEREAYDLLGIDFPGHPDLRRIMMTDDWEGYPLRKDYEPIDPEV